MFNVKLHEIKLTINRPNNTGMLSEEHPICARWIILLNLVCSYGK